MAKKTTRQNNKKDYTSKALETNITNKEKIRFIIGIGLLFLSIFIFISLISYINTWKQDQSHILSSESSFSYLFYNESPVMNWCGRLGATLSHLFMYQGIGLMSFIFAIWIGLISLNVLNGERKYPAGKWFRWLMFGVLFLSPLLALTFDHKNFPFGGLFGNFITQWTFGFAGHIGTWFILVTIGLIFLTLVFQWDLKPYLAKLQSISFKRAEDVSEKVHSQYDDQVQFAESGLVHVNQKQQSDQSDSLPSTLTMDSQFVTQNEYVEPESDGVIDTKSAHVIDEEDFGGVSGIQLIELPVENELVQPIVTNEISDSVETEAPASIVTHKDGIVIEVPSMPSGIEMDRSIEDEMVIDLEINPSYQDDVTVTESDNEQIPVQEQQHHTPQIAGLEVVESKVDDIVKLDGNASVVNKKTMEPYDPDQDLSDYKFPILDLLEAPQIEGIALDADELAKNKEQITNTLRSFGIEIQRIQATVGPTVTLYEIVPQEGVRISKIRNLEDDIALNLAALGIRMIAPIPGRGTIGIEVPNARKQIVPMRTLLSSEKFINNDMSLPIALGKKIDNDNYIVDLATMPHLLMAGATGQGKSVGINAILVSLLYKKHPSQLKFVLVDPKKVELSIYKLIENHYLAKLPNEEESIITDTKKVINTLSSLCIEMDNRYELLKDAGTRNIKEYNAKFVNRKLNPERGHKYLPFIVLVIDEFADLIMTAGKEVEAPVARLAQLARAVGIHLIVATQRPSVNVITGIIKANFPARIAFRVTSKVDSRTILDTGGADQLIGRGDMLVSVGSDLMRVQCAFVDTPEVEKIVEFIGEQRGFPTPYELPEYEGAEDEQFEKKDVDLSKRDKLFEECARLIVNSQSGSTSMLQRKFNLGYNRAGRIMDQLEAAGIVGAQSGSKPRDVLVSSETELEHILALL